ncbi:MAG: hypothetical protein ACREOI_17935, partial [bacterium]
MKRSTLLFGFWLLLMSSTAFAQTNVRGWYADGQVWILWDLDNSPPETYAIYSSANPFTNTNQAQLTGRLFEAEWTPLALRTQVNAAANYVIPDGQGGRFTVPRNTGLFVETVHENGAKYYAVVKWNNTAVTASNRSSRIEYRFSPNEPVQCHPQVSGKLASGHNSTAYYMWADGRDNHWEGRPDFPIMGNRHKNGMPSFFILSEALAMPAANRSLVVWLHGGGGTAFQSLPTFRERINIEPQEGFLLAMNDDFIRLVQDSLVTEGSVSWHFGWTKKHDPFQPKYVVADDDTIVNYTQRRYIWIVDWLIKNKNVNPARVAVQGHSMGAAGTTALAKAFPHRFATASIFNNGFEGLNELPGWWFIFGGPTTNLPTTLKTAGGRVVPILDCFDLTSLISASRDLPLMRTWNGKNDDDGVMRWDSEVVSQYRAADSLAHGMQLYWDEREHGVDVRPAHWTLGNSAATQTYRDNAANQERYRADQSYPAFFNHHRYPGIGKDPGDGTRGTGVGDDWGSYGGYHEWDTSSIGDSHSAWEVKAWLINNASFPNDNSPDANLTSDLAIRKPQQFKPPTGRQLQWSVTRLSNNQILQSGTTTVGANDLVSLTGVTVYKDPDR